MRVNQFVFAVLLLITIEGCSDSKINAQTNNISQEGRVGGKCEGCDAIYENTTPFNALDWQLTLPGYNDRNRRLHISGTVYQADGKTPAGGIILYVYHTDQSGNYPRKGNETGWGQRHGYIRGWLKTNSQGQYSIRTTKPGSYPGGGAAAHIHCIVKEDKLNEYYIGDFLFDDDPLLTSRERSTQTPGGSGVLKLQQRNGISSGVRNIYLGKYIRNYPSSAKQIYEFIFSGLTIRTSDQ